MRIDVITLFPETLQPYFTASILGRAQATGCVEIHTHQLRDFSNDPHQKVDDRPFGGGPGMILACQPLMDAVAAVEALDPRSPLRIIMSPQGRVFDQSCAADWAGTERLLFICGHYEGVDERVIELLQPIEVSLGDFVLTGGEPAALAMIDAVVRLLPGALGNEVATTDESFQNRLLEYPQYTRPREFRGLSVPDVLLSGHHGQIEAWRRAQAEQRTRRRRPDLLGDSGGDLVSAQFAEALTPLLANGPGPQWQREYGTRW
ncbi:MAG: tRNA (guanosine(37)-N1)-methyltransferase TrmD [Phycisphaerales bacterium]|nr:tRNA (guanosine(37)-N1)-methyltransferase TrmD [Phycisphaerales bacterium]